MMIGPGSDLEEQQRILIVDDAADCRLMLSRHLQREGFLVSTARSGREALALIAHVGMPNLIVLDIMMPEMDGFTLAAEIRKRGDVPIICLSSIADSVTKAAAITQFAEDYVTKPCDYRELTARIRRVLTYFVRRCPAHCRRKRLKNEHFGFLT